MTREKEDHPDGLLGWKEIKDLPVLDELNRALAKRGGMSRSLLIEIAKRSTRFRHPSNLKTGRGLETGLTFLMPSGSVLLTFPYDWPPDPSERTARLCKMSASVADCCTAVARFHVELEQVLLPTEAHAGDGG